MPSLLNSWVVALLVIGALVDLAQAAWILRRAFSRVRRRVYHKIERQVLEAQAKAKTKE